MRDARRGSVRYWLQRIALFSLPLGIYPFNKTWKFGHYRHGQQLQQVVLELREIADGLEKRLNEIAIQAREHSQS